MTMKLYQPVLFVGLGGTGCDVGAELERRLREEICGPDGTEFMRSRAKSDALPYQLPSCVQFVYADMNQAELDRMPARVVPGSAYLSAARLTAHYVRDLVPLVDSYPELARNLRLSAPRAVESWLPPKEDEPRVNPLHRGAGQFPTVGRAALFGTFTHGIRAAVREVNDAIGRLSNSGEDLFALGGRPPRAVDVFVAFSVAGGTGGGIFYDFLHLIGAMFEQSRLKAKIYPLVLMPSAFDPGLGGGRHAELNAGRALLDLFRLVDEQNGGDAERDLRSHDDKELLNPDEQAVYYPVEGKITLRPGIVQTGFLFSRPVGAEREDLHRSIASLVTSLIGTELEESDERHGESHQSFADSFVNSAVHREVPAENGIGNRGVSAALVASMTVPVDEIAGIVASRMLRTAFDMMRRPPGQLESNQDHIKDFLVKSGIPAILTCRGSDITEPEAAHGSREITTALGDRRDAMQAGLRDLKSRLDREVPQLVSGFDPRQAARELLGSIDAFHVYRVLFGRPDAEGIDKGGVLGLLQSRAAPPPSADGLAVTPPPVPALHNRFFGLIKLRWSDAVPAEFRLRQDAWHRWRTIATWAEQWAGQAPVWRRPLEQVQQELRLLIRDLEEFAREDKERFGRRTMELYRRRVGVSYLLPPGGADMERFYERLVRGLTEHWVRLGRLKPNATEADLIEVIVGTDGWRKAYDASIEHSPGQAVSELREMVKREVKTFLRAGVTGQIPMLPRLHDLLADAAAPTDASSVLREYLDEFRGKLAGLVPANFTPQGNGMLKVLISYPADAKSPIVEDYLTESINLPAGPDINYELRNTATESISVVLFRTSMGVTEVREVREVLRLWASALGRPQATDKLRWRQRTGYDFGYLATREEHRILILHRLMCALWNGRVLTDGPPDSPDRIRVELDGGVAMLLPLTPFAPASSWGSLLRAYELWTFDDNDIHRLFCAQLMQELPMGIGSRVLEPSPLYKEVCDLAQGEIVGLDRLLAKLPSGSRSRAGQMRSFWADTLPAALSHPFTGMDAPLRSNLSQLNESLAGTQ
jgi:hypothetical protein